MGFFEQWASLNADGKVPVARVDAASDCQEMAGATVCLGWDPVGPMAACKAFDTWQCVRGKCSRMAARWTGS